jgi:hypothetical protein
MAPRLYRGYGPRDLGQLKFTRAVFDPDSVRASGPAPDAAERATHPFVGITTDGTPIQGLFSLDEGPGASTKDITDAAEALVAVLAPGDRTLVELPIDSDRWRVWTNAFPTWRPQGLLLDDLDAGPRDAVVEILRASLSERGFCEARNIMALNAALGDLIDNFHDSLKEWMYWFTLFGTPSHDEPWGWQLAGHHLDLHCLVLKDRVVMTPAFMGAEPTQADDGPWAGIRVLAEEELAGLEFMRSLTEGERVEATLFPSMLSRDLPPEWRHPMEGRMRVAAARDNVIVPYEGLCASSLRPDQRRRLVELLEVYTGRMAPAHARYTLAGLEAHLDSTYFAWIGGCDDDDPFYYKVHSPVVLVEFDHHPGVFLANTEPERFHAHTVVRTPNGNDYGKDLLAQHYRLHHQKASA